MVHVLPLLVVVNGLISPELLDKVNVACATGGGHAGAKCLGNLDSQKVRRSASWAASQPVRQAGRQAGSHVMQGKVV